MGYFRRIFKSIAWPLFRFYLRKKRKFRYKAYEFVVYPGVFPPIFTKSSSIFMDFIESIDFKEKKVLDLGCGTGCIGIYASMLGARLTAADINPIAIENTKYNADQLGVEVQTVHSDLFDKIEPQFFDFILINPPYFPHNPENDAEKAWFCGENFEYFSKLFTQISKYINEKSEVYLILSEDCELMKISGLAEENGKELSACFREKVRAENIIVFKLI